MRPLRAAASGAVGRLAVSAPACRVPARRGPPARASRVQPRRRRGDQLGRGPAVGRERRGAHRERHRDRAPTRLAERRLGERRPEPLGGDLRPPRGRRRAGGSRTRRRRSGPGRPTPAASRGSPRRPARTSSPSRWPKVSLTSLKSSRSSISRLSGDRAAGPDGLLAEPLVEVAVVEEAGQRVAIGEGPGLFVRRRSRARSTSQVVDEKIASFADDRGLLLGAARAIDPWQTTY